VAAAFPAAPFAAVCLRFRRRVPPGNPAGVLRPIDDAMIWDDTPAMPLLYNSFEEQGKSPDCEIHEVHEVEAFG